MFPEIRNRGSHSYKPNMTKSDRPQLSPDLDAVAARLERERPSASTVADLKPRVRSRVASPTASRGAFFASRVGIALILVVGLVLGGAGGALAISGISSSGSASVAQYKPPTTHHPCQGRYRVRSNPACNGILGINNGGHHPNNGNRGNNGNGNGGNNGEQGENGSGAPTTSNAVQSGRQIGATGSGRTLPFTGFLAIPLLLAGVALLIAGLALRRRRAPGV